MPCTVKKTFEIARDTGNALIVQIKTNQPGLHDALAAICAAEAPVESAETTDRRRHGRQEHRRVETYDVRIRTKPGHFARFRSFALNILRANGTDNISRELFINALNPNHALAYSLI